MKSCSTCGHWKPDSAFYPERRPHRSRDGLHHACKACERAAARECYHARANRKPWYSPLLRTPRDERGQFAPRASGEPR